MTPTTKLRFVERKIQVPIQGDFVVTYKTIRILQQWWVGTEVFNVSEWRDVPLEEEQT
jgi:hypothetical protein